MICLKTRTFAVSQTTLCLLGFLLLLLWFAWKLVLLQYRKQPLLKLRLLILSCDLLENSYFCSIANNKEQKRDDTRAGCDLLENSYFCSIANNLQQIRITPRFVVICLKTRTFAVSQTTYRLSSINTIELWFAWKLVLLQYRKQLLGVIEFIILSCDLLENSYFCSIANNRVSALIFWYSLWFAWKLVLLQYRKQPIPIPHRPLFRCDLLENSYFCSIANNPASNVLLTTGVVICLKTRTFAVSQTT